MWGHTFDSVRFVTGNSFPVRGEADGHCRDHIYLRPGLDQIPEPPNKIYLQAFPYISMQFYSQTTYLGTTVANIFITNTSSSQPNKIVSLGSSSSCLRLLPLLPVPFVLPFIFASEMCFRRQFLMQDVTNRVSLPSFHSV